MEPTDFVQKVQFFIAQNRIGDAIQLALKQFQHNSSYYNHVVIISNNYNGWVSQKIMGLLPSNKILNSIINRLLLLINNYLNPAQVAPNKKTLF